MSAVVNVPDIISGSFCVSRTAAMGIPKLDAGPQKSVVSSGGQHIALVGCRLVAAWHGAICDQNPTIEAC